MCADRNREMRVLGQMKSTKNIMLFFIGAALVGATGFFGGSLIYGIDHYAW